MILDCNNRSLDLSRIAIMGILNVTPDSFSDGGKFVGKDAAIRHAVSMAEAGAAIIDVGGESTRPGAQPVSEENEIARVVPVIEAIMAEIDVPVSIDTSKQGVMKAAVTAGAGLINDVRALREEGALAMAASLGVPVCLMHMQGEPRNMQAAPHYEDVVIEVRDFLLARAAACEAAGIDRSRVLLDPGFGFGKTLAHNLALLKHLPVLSDTGYNILVGLSRKSMIEKLLGLPVGERLHASIALAVLAASKGAQIIRVHDVMETVQAIRMTEAVMAAD